MRKIVRLSGKKREGDVKDLNSSIPVYVHITEPTDQELEEISKIVDYSASEIREDLKPISRPKIIDLNTHSLLVFRSPYISSKNRIIKTAPIVIIISKRRKNVILITNKYVPAIEKFENFLKSNSDITKRSMSYFLFMIMDFIEDSFFEIVEKIGTQVEVVESKALLGNKETVRHVFLIKKSLIYLHKALVANREVVSSIEKEYVSDIEKKDIKHFRSLYSDLTQIIESVATYSEILTGTLEVHLSTISNNLNEIMKRVTVWGTLILIPTVISGIYGMNFRHMPELEWQYGYLFALSLMVGAITFIYLYFRRKGWT